MSTQVIAERAPVRSGKKLISYGYRVTTTTAPPSPQIQLERQEWIQGFKDRYFAKMAEQRANEDRIQPC